MAEKPNMLDTASILAVIGTAIASPKLWSAGKHLMSVWRDRHRNDTRITLAQISSDRRVIPTLMERIENLEERVNRLEAERSQLHEELVESRAETKRINAILADREEYIQQLEQDHANQGRTIADLTSKIEQLTKILTDRYSKSASANQA